MTIGNIVDRRTNAPAPKRRKPRARKRKARG